MKTEHIIDPRIKIPAADLEKMVDLPISISLCGEFDEQLAHSFVQAVNIAENRILKNGQQFLPILINSYGGDCYAAVSCMDALLALDERVIPVTYVSGKAMSAGAFLFACGKYRYMQQNSTLMFHAARTGGVSGAVDDLEIDIQSIKSINSRLLRVASKRMGKKENFLEQLIKKNADKDVFLEAEPALDLGICTKIGTPKFKVELKVDYTLIV